MHKLWDAIILTCQNKLSTEALQLGIIIVYTKFKYNCTFIKKYNNYYYNIYKYDYHNDIQYQYYFEFKYLYYL